MSVALESVHKLDIFYDAGENVPPPYHYAYHLELTLKPSGLDANFDLRYLNREELTEEEILEEGFTLQDDWSWSGSLPQLWLEALQEQMTKSIWPNKPKEAREGEAVLEIQLLSQPGEVLFAGRPADVPSWEYFLQEIMQAIYEVAQKEAPFALHYLEIDDSNIEIWLNASFAERKASARQVGMEGPGSESTRELSWPALKKLLKTVYMPDYDYDNASDFPPTEPGRHVSTGEGVWFTFGESLLEPGANTNSLDRLEAALKEIFTDQK
ncbi:hypothetical protein [Cesiribacter sp. SM1]|uniref:hypothetical protein n=1 Tax=Cesiribacter sp. SM1 TaxID=2861196 RepID=UPI001CD4C448|nr:hypothetical protein [Cesiribacter sp. SM1]